MLRLTGLSFAHPRVAAGRRAQLVTPPGGLEAARRRVRAIGVEIFFLPTCLRVEVAWLGDEAPIDDVRARLYPGDDVGGEVRHDEEAFRHLARVAAGLDSPLIGEPEVLGQVRRAMIPLGESEIRRVLETAVAVARAARRELDEMPRGSLAAAAAEASAPLGRVAVLGGGAMARATLARLSGVEVAVYARRPDPVAGRSPRPWADVAEALATYPAVISTVPGKSPLMSTDELASIAANRGEPLLLVDLGMPPALPAGGTEGIRYLGVDELAATVSSPAAAEAEERIGQDSAAAWRRLSAPNTAGAVIAAVMSQADAAVAEEIERLIPRLAAGDPEELLRQVAHRVARRLLHPPISYLGNTDEQSVEVLAAAFGVRS